MEKENGIKEISFWKSVILAVLLAAGIIFFLFYLLQMAPLGKYAFSADDARIQYIDYFSFYKGILSGLNNPIYSFSKGLGGNVWGVMAYYLLSPLNGLIVFFTQKKLNSFYDILVLLKFSLASGTMAYYLQKRFHGTIESPFVILLGICYGLMQYNFEQAKNVMWLDPVTLFPLLLLGTYKVQRGNSILFLSIVIGLALIFNWYMGMIATMAAGFWSVWESLGIAIHQKSIEWKQWIFYECKIIAAILLGVCLAGAVLVPAFSTMAGGRAGIDWNVLNRRYIGSNSSFLLGLQSGAISTNQHVALFSGSFTVFCSLLWFINPKGLLRNKLWVLGLLLLLLPLFYWRPAYFLFSLLKNATSYWYRYSFVGIFPFLYLAGQALSCHAEKSIFHSFRKYLLLIYPVVVLFVAYRRPFQPLKYLIASICCFILLFIFMEIRVRSNHLNWQRMATLCIAGVTLCEVMGNAYHVMKLTRNPLVGQYEQHTKEAQEQWDRLQSMDSSVYRINQTHPFLTEDKNTSANFNEPLAFHYPGISSYTSSPDNIQMRLMDSLGYRQGSENLNVTVQSVLGADALLGVKYIHSKLDIAELPLAFKEQLNGEKTYRNPYAFPLAFVVNQTAFREITYQKDPFLYQNEVFSALAGERIEAYKPITYKRFVKKEKQEIYDLPRISGNAILYGNIPTEKDVKGVLDINGSYHQKYSDWLTPSVFYIPQVENKENHIQFSYQQKTSKIFQPQFYYLDLAVLQKEADRHQKQAAIIVKMKDGYVEIDADAQNNQALFTSIPYDKGWHIQVNGKTVKPILFADCLMGIPMENGNNKVIMEYHLPGVKLGCAVSLIGVGILILIWRRQKKIKY
jgi:uncharacterized membrane protein YfhO